MAKKTVVEREGVEHGPHSGGSSSDQGGPAIVFKGAGHKLGAAGGFFVDQDAHGYVCRFAARLDRMSLAITLSILFQNDRAFAQEFTGGGERFIDQSSGTTAQIQDKALSAILSSLLNRSL
jgi:hypothetical protein